MTSRAPAESQLRPGSPRCQHVAVERGVELLSPTSPLIDTVVGWHWREWSDDHEDADLDAWRDGIRGRTNDDRVPFTLVAFLDGEAVGCLSVTEDDYDE